ncbi:hypothetical protein BCR33DRAFT_772000 [Rhizoclosmatium globosum]|uniref:Uncharacterized protein n=1 Tax=Rhizoclosmatium globosum TaxID=329046 RepID=A0A1Y2B8M5_9FUNG|nr:hypothetical protein BCR33DRAFT_772000 [Rhizoclosmatium globosum]|eukprot:ORY31182.1 hypothetical protein BCR33DRAFT_772000 [Rhizoclosmatium globosum]
MQQPFEQLLLSIDDEIQANTIPQPESTPYLPPEIWSRIFVMTFGNMRQLSRISRLCKSVYLYCWLSPAAKANFYFECYGKRQAIFMLHVTNCWRSPQFREILTIMINNGGGFSCLDQFGKACPLLQLMKLPDAVEYIQLFYSCDPHISEDHMRYALGLAVKNGRLDLVCALLQENPASVKPSTLNAHLEEKGVEYDLKQLIARNHRELFFFLASGKSSNFSADAVAYAIKMEYLEAAREIVNARLDYHSTQLSQHDSNRVWYELGYKNLTHVEVALSLGVAPTYNSFLSSSGLFQYVYFENLMVRQSWDHLENPKIALKHDSLLFADLFVRAGFLINQMILVNAVYTGAKEYVQYLLEKWSNQDNYLETNIICSYTFCNAFMWRNWELVEILISACRKWAEVSGQPFTEALNLADSEDVPNIIVSPMTLDDLFFFTKVPILVKLNVFPETIYTFALEEIAHRFHEESHWPEARTCMEKLFSLGAKITSKAVINSSQPTQGDAGMGASSSFKFLWERFELERNIGFVHFPEVILYANDGSKEIIEMILRKGVPVTQVVLLNLYFLFFRFSPVEPLAHILLKAVKPGNLLQHTFLDYLETMESIDLYESDEKSFSKNIDLKQHRTLLIEL